jgi:hypothetical protein
MGVASITGGATETIYYQADASAFPVPVWTGFTGTTITTFADPALGIAYTPGDATKWAATAPATVQAALDRMAAAVERILGHAIP